MLNYETAWRCVHCAAAGTVTTSTNDGCDTLYGAVVEQHAEISPTCQRTGGLALQSPAAAGPEARQ